jgi:multidrug efflux pump subunit AcrB
VVDREKAIKQGVALNDVYRTIQAFMGGLFVNYFNRFGRQWQVYVEAEGEYRTRPENLGQFYVRNGTLAILCRFPRWSASSRDPAPSSRCASTSIAARN